jgi:hypothetical protein
MLLSLVFSDRSEDPPERLTNNVSRFEAVRTHSYTNVQGQFTTQRLAGEGVALRSILDSLGTVEAFGGEGVLLNQGFRKSRRRAFHPITIMARPKSIRLFL